MHVLLPDGVEVRVRVVHRLGLLEAHREGLVMRAGESFAGAQLGEHGLHVLDRAAHPLQLDVLGFFLGERRTHLMIGDDCAVVALGWFVQLDLVIFDRGGLELLGDALFHIACRLPDLEQTSMCVIVDGVGVNSWPDFRLWRKDFLDGGLMHRRRPSGGPASRRTRSHWGRAHTSRRGPRPSTASSSPASAQRYRPCVLRVGMACAGESEDESVDRREGQDAFSLILRIERADAQIGLR